VTAWWSWPRVTTAGAADLSAAMKWSAVPLVMSLMLVDFFDTIGTATAIAEEAGIVEPDGSIPRLKALLAVDALSASVGGWLGARRRAGSARQKVRAARARLGSRAHGNDSSRLAGGRRRTGLDVHRRRRHAHGRTPRARGHRRGGPRRDRVLHGRRVRDGRAA